MRTWIGNADSAGLQIAVHAIGDRANAILLDIYDSVARAHGPRDRRFRDEHSQHLRPQDIARFGRIGVVASMQPIRPKRAMSWGRDRKSTRLNSSHSQISYAVFCLKKKKRHDYMSLPMHVR